MTMTGSIRVSVLDDHILIREGLEQVLNAAGLQVVASYGNARQFLVGLGSDRPTVAIVDLMLAGQDGFAVLEELRRRDPALPVLVVSGHVDPQVATRCQQMGARGYLAKYGAGHEEVVRAVRDVAAGKTVFPPQATGGLPEGPVVPIPATTPELDSLSPREREALALVAEGHDNLKIAAALGITERTVKAHVSSLYRKLGVENRTQMALLAHRLKVRSFPPERSDA